MTAAAPARNASTEHLRSYFKIGPRTLRNRNGRDMNKAILEHIRTEENYPGSYSERIAPMLRPAFPVLRAWDKFVDGYRLPGTTHHALTSLTPWKLTALIGRMIDAGITNNAQAERWFAENRAEIESWAPRTAIEQIRYG